LSAEIKKEGTPKTSGGFLVKDFFQKLPAGKELYIIFAPYPSQEFCFAKREKERERERERERLCFR